MISTIAARSIRAGILMGRGGDIDGVGFTWPKLVGAAYVRTRVRFVVRGRFIEVDVSPDLSRWEGLGK